MPDPAENTQILEAHFYASATVTHADGTTDEGDDQ